MRRMQLNPKQNAPIGNNYSTYKRAYDKKSSRQFHNSYNCLEKVNLVFLCKVVITLFPFNCNSLGKSIFGNCLGCLEKIAEKRQNKRRKANIEFPDGSTGSKSVSRQLCLGHTVGFSRLLCCQTGRC